jgi:hypothetical protein
MGSNLRLHNEKRVMQACLLQHGYWYWREIDNVDNVCSAVCLSITVNMWSYTFLFISHQSFLSCVT